MSKELDAFRIMVKDNDLELPYHNTIIAIENALKRLEENDLFAKNQSKNDFIGIKVDQHEKDQKKLKAFEIIKKKGVNLYKLKMCDSVEEYNKLCNSDLPLTKEQFDLLKEVLL